MQHKKTFLLLVLISWIIIEGCKAPPITITQSQIEAVFTPGRTMRLFWDSTSQPVNVGRTGGPNVYDFSTLPFVMYDSSEMFSVSQIPQLAPRYPSNAVAASEEGGTVYPVFSFSNNKFYREGRARLSSATTEWYQHIIPADEWLRFPVTFNTQFSQTNTVVVDTTYVNGIPTKTSADTGSGTKYVDGYGTLLLPGGLAFKCLRMRLVASFPKTYKSFQFWTREGAVVLIDSETSQPDTGVVRREYVIYFSPQTRNQNTRD
ncbi:MAG: hypothetical protein HY707_01850 [Ignavibacteriae bacterium]|nr:hypothetical protein [Ignavibacteriota bacterium]